MANDVAKKTNGSLALFGDDAKGFDNMTQDDLALPFVRILGQLSPQVTAGDAKYMEDAKPGMIFNTVTNELFDGAEAQTYGFATEVNDEPLARAMDLATEIASKNPDAVVAAKRMCNSLGDSTDAELLLAESVEQTDVIYQPNQLEAVAAFFEKRSANFK